MTSTLLQTTHQINRAGCLTLTGKFSMYGYSKRIISLILFCILLPGVLVADTQSEDPESVKIITPVYRPDFSPALGTYTYTISWQGIPAAEVRVGVEREGLSYKIWTKLKTYSAIDLFYKLRYSADAKLSVVDFAPIQSVYRAQENSRVKEAELTFMNDGEIHAIRRSKGRDPEYKRFSTDNFTLDPFSAGFIARGIDWEVGKTNVFDAYNGKSRYLISLTATGKKILKVNGIERSVWVIEPRVQKIGDTGKSKLRQAKIYLTDDSFREILEIESEVFVGSVRTELEKFQPSTHSVPGTQVATHYLMGEEVSVK